MRHAKSFSSILNSEGALILERSHDFMIQSQSQSFLQTDPHWQPQLQAQLDPHLAKFLPSEGLHRAGESQSSGGGLCVSCRGWKSMMWGAEHFPEQLDGGRRRGKIQAGQRQGEAVGFHAQRRALLLGSSLAREWEESTRSGASNTSLKCRIATEKFCQFQNNWRIYLQLFCYFKTEMPNYLFPAPRIWEIWCFSLPNITRN